MDKVDIAFTFHLFAAAVHVGFAWLAVRRWQKAGRALEKHHAAERHAFELARQYVDALGAIPTMTPAKPLRAVGDPRLRNPIVKPIWPRDRD